MNFDKCKVPVYILHDLEPVQTDRLTHEWRSTTNWRCKFDV